MTDAEYVAEVEKLLKEHDSHMFSTGCTGSVTEHNDRVLVRQLRALSRQREVLSDNEIVELVQHGLTVLHANLSQTPWGSFKEAVEHHRAFMSHVDNLLRKRA